MTTKQEQKSPITSAPPSPSISILLSAVSCISLAATKDLTNEASCGSDEESEGSAGEVLPDALEYDAQSGRSEILQNIFTFASTSSSASVSRSDTHLSKRSTATGPGSAQDTVHTVQFKVVPDTKMKIIFVSGPYGIGKSYVLRAAHHGLHTTHSHVGGLRYKFHVQASNYTKTSMFFTWKKIVSNLLMRLRLHGFDHSDSEHSNTEGVDALSPIPEHHASTPSKLHAHNNVNDWKASLLPKSSIMKGIKKQELLQRNIHHLISLLDPLYTDFEPLLMNGFLCT